MKSIVKLYKPTGVQITNLTDILKLNRIRKYSGIDELYFTLPEYIEDTETGYQIENPDIELVKYDYNIKYDNAFYLVRGINKKVDKGIKRVEITCYSKVIQLKDRKCSLTTGVVQGDTVISAKNLSDSASLLLANTTYSIGTVDAILDTKFRAVDISTNIIDGLNKLCEYWECVWQASGNKINFIDYKNNYTFNGLFLSDANYIKGMNLNMREDSIITRLNISGVNGIGVNSVNNGKSFIDDFSFYKTTDYMNQSEIDALNAYETAIANSKSTYTTYLNELAILQSTLTTKEDESVLLKASLNNKQIEIDTASANGTSTTTLKAEYNTINSNVNIKQTEINTVNTQISAKNVQITTLNNSLAIGNYLNTEQQSLLNEFIKESDFKDSTITAKGIDIVTLQELLEAGQEYLSLNNSPRFDAEIDIIAFNQLSDKESQADSSRLILGSLVMIYVKKLGIQVNARVIEIEEDYDGFQLNIKISNQKDIQDESFKLTELLEQSSDTKNLVGINIDKWSQGETANNFISENISNGINTLNTEIRNSSNTYSFSERGGVFVDKDNPNYATIISGKGIMLSTDGGLTPSIAMGRGQIYGEKIGSHIIVSNSGLFNSLQTFDNSNNLVCELGNFTSGIDGSLKRGMKINGGALEIIGNAPSLKFGNNVVIDSTNGISVLRSDNKVKVSVNGTDGIKIATGTGTGAFPTTVLSFDTLGNATFGGIVDAKDLKIQGTPVLTSTGLIKGSSISADSLYVNSANITGTITADSVRSSWVYTNVINANQINGNIANLASGVNIGNVYSNEEKTLTFYNSGTAGNSCQIRANTDGSLSINGYQALYLGEGGGTQIELSEGQIKFNGTVKNITASTFVQPSHNHGIPNGTRLAICNSSNVVVGSVLWAESGGFAHDHIIY